MPDRHDQPDGATRRQFTEADAPTVSQSELDATTDRPVELNPPSCPQKIDRYDVVGILGHGAFGVVFEAVDPLINRRVAVKVARTAAGLADEDEADFLKEARKAASIKHPNIVTVFDAGRCPQVGLYIVTELVEGSTLKDLIRGGSLTPPQAARLIAQVAAALHAAHRSELVHRDIKPANILVDHDGNAMVADFGLALPDREQAAERGVVSGTVYYMSPEQIRGDAHLLDGRSDIWSLGVVLYECLTGKRPFGPGDFDQIREEVEQREPKPLRQHDERIPHSLEEICNRCLAKKVSDRYATAIDLQRDLERAIPSLDSGSLLSGQSNTLTISGRHVPAVLRERPQLFMSVGFLSILALVAVAWWNLQPPAQHRQAAPPARPPWFDYSAAGAKEVAKEVRILTEPSGAEVVVYPISAPYGFPDGSKRQAGTSATPCTLTLDPGEYLVVVVLDSGRFHEVYRTVSRFEYETPADAYPHRMWLNRRNNAIEWPVINIPERDVAEGMAFFNGADAFEMGEAGNDFIPSHKRFVAPFYLDRHEVSWQRFLAGNHGRTTPSFHHLKNPPKTTEAVGGIWFNDAVAWAEKQGLRLPTEAEYEYAATLGGTRPFPWGDDASLTEPWTFGPVGEPEFDVVDSGRPVFGLFSNVAEWTYSWAAAYPPRQDILGRLPPRRDGSWIVRGGPSAIRDRGPLETIPQHARGRFAAMVKTKMSGVGFRCARSANPRINAEDLERYVPPVAAP